MTTENSKSNSTAPYSAKVTTPSRLMFLACLLGAVVGVIFILVQPLFGLETLTSRHAASYQQLGGLAATPAMLMAWLAHMTVSVAYGVISGLVVINFERLTTVGLLTLFFAWITTVIAPPANAIIVQLVSFQRIYTEKLPALNFSLDEKFVLHLLFFAAITGVLFIYKHK